MSLYKTPAGYERVKQVAMIACNGFSYQGAPCSVKLIEKPLI